MSRSDAHACSEYNRLSRRGFLGVGAALAGASLVLPSAAFGRDGPPRISIRPAHIEDRDTLVVVFLRGGCDGLTMVPPHGDPAYYALRPNLAIAPPGSGPNAARDLDGYFGFAPGMQALLPAYLAGHLAVIQAVGSPDQTRSHFDAQRSMELGYVVSDDDASGWLSRYLSSVSPETPGAILRGVSQSAVMKAALLGAKDTIAIPEPGRFGLTGPEESRLTRLARLAEMYEVVPDPLRSTAASTREAISLLEQIDFEHYVPAGGALYPQSEFGRSLRASAALIKADVGVETLALDRGGWDLHTQQGPIQGAMANGMSDFAASLAAFHADVVANRPDVTVVVMSEFGRRAAENASLGTDHGHGNCMFVLSGRARGGRVITHWPGLADLHEGLDLRSTIDYRDILGEVLAVRMGCSNLHAVFPGYVPGFYGVVEP